jgi:hypothetical protein
MAYWRGQHRPSSFSVVEELGQPDHSHVGVSLLGLI